MDLGADARTRRMERSGALPGYIYHPSFAAPDAARTLDGRELLAAGTGYEARYMPDEMTRDHARRMHYAAYRMHAARGRAVADRWREVYLGMRDRIVLGNRKLIYQAVRRRMAEATRAEDTIGDCHIVLINAVAAYNPWVGVRFSTYAYTCLLRALGRLAQRHAADRLTRAFSLENLPDAEPADRGHESAPHDTFRLDEYLRDDHPLLTGREKQILARRFKLSDEPGGTTLELVGRALGLSKERVRQVQASALEKLRATLSAPAR